MSTHLSPAESAIISSILEKTLYKQLIYDECLEMKPEKDDLSAEQGPSKKSKACRQLEKVKKDSEWLQNLLRNTIDELATKGTYQTLIEVIRKEEDRNRREEWEQSISHEPDESSSQQRPKPPEIEDGETEMSVVSYASVPSASLSDEQLMQNVADAELAVSRCPISDMRVYGQIAADFVNSHKLTTSDIVQNRLQIEYDRQALQRMIDEVKHKKAVEERTLDLQRKFLTDQMRKRAAATENWYKRFYLERDELYGDLVKVRQDIDTLQERNLVAEEAFLKKRELLQEHHARAKERVIRIESEVPFRNVQSWWRGAMVRLQLGKYRTKFEELQSTIHKRKEEEAKFIKKLKTKYGGSGKIK